MSGDVVARARAALEGVTEGPWRWEATPPKADDHDYVWGPGRAQMICAMDLIDGETADGEFFAAARGLVPELVSEVERLREFAERARGLAAGKAIAAHALGHSDVERGWLDLMAVGERLGVFG